MLLERSALPTVFWSQQPFYFSFEMSGSHVSLPALDIEREQQVIDSLITSLQQYKPTRRSSRDLNSAASAATTPKSAPLKAGRGRPPKNKEVPSSPVVPVGDALCENSLELVIECLNKLNSQNQKLFNLVTELDSKVQEQNKTIETLNTKIASCVEKIPSPSDDASPPPTNELFSTVVKRVNKIEENINSHLLLCRGPAVIKKITDSKVNGVVDLDKVKAEICAEVCGETVSRISVLALGVSIYGKNKNLLKIECASVNVRDHLLEQARKRKPAGIYLAEFLSPEKLKLHRRVNELKREFPGNIRAVYIRRGDIFCKSEPDGDVIRITEDENIDDLRRQFAVRPANTAVNGAAVAE